MRELPEADITINGQRLSPYQSRVLRTALQFARKDAEQAPNDLLAVGLLTGINDLLMKIDETEATL